MLTHIYGCCRLWIPPDAHQGEADCPLEFN